MTKVLHASIPFFTSGNTLKQYLTSPKVYNTDLDVICKSLSRIHLIWTILPVLDTTTTGGKSKEAKRIVKRGHLFDNQETSWLMGPKAALNVL